MIAHLSRRSIRLAPALALTVGFALLATPASAEVPEGWSNPDEISRLEVLWLLGGIPLALFVGIALLVYVPSLVRGEGLTPAGPAQDEWFGGPRKGTDELAAPDSEGSEAGGASARW